MVSVLGKRHRSSIQLEDAPARSTRAKKRAIEHTAGACPQVAKQERPLSSKTGLFSPKARLLCSPAKQRAAKGEPIQIWQDEAQPSPTTPRHRDTLAKKVAVTPRHRVLGKSLPGTPFTPRTPARTRTLVYNQARELFSRSTDPGKLVGREDEREELRSFLAERIDNNHGGCLYISGPPGTGKSALVAEVQGRLDTSTNVRTATINCMSIRTAEDLRSKLNTELALSIPRGKLDLSAAFKSQVGQCLLVLDEVDRLAEVNQDLLYSVFEHAMSSDSQLILVGIANALDLTDRCLPKLRSRGIKPDLLPFMPYSAAQIANVLTSKLKTLGTTEESGMPPFLHPAAIQFCAKKVAAQTGDLRKAFDICRRAIDLVEKETIGKDAALESPIKMPLMENVNLSSPITPRSPSKSPEKFSISIPAYTVASAPKATIAHMAKVTAQVFSNGTSQRLASLNLQQKAVLCSLAALEQRKQASQINRAMYDTPSKTDRSAPSVRQLCDAYTLLCKQSDMLHPLSTVEFRDVVSGLEAQTLIASADGKGGSFAMPITPSRTPSRKQKTGFIGVPTGDERRVASVIGRKELESGLHGAGADLLRDILTGHC